MDNFVTYNYDTWAVLITVLCTLVAFVLIKQYPQRSYNYMRELRIVKQSELSRLYREIESLTSYIDMLQTAPIKKESDGQLNFTQMADSPTQRTLRLPFNIKNGAGVVERWEQVWNVSDYQHWKDQEILVKRDKRRIWVAKKEKNDEELQPYRWEKVRI